MFKAQRLGSNSLLYLGIWNHTNMILVLVVFFFSKLDSTNRKMQITQMIWYSTEKWMHISKYVCNQYWNYKLEYGELTKSPHSVSSSLPSHDPGFHRGLALPCIVSLRGVVTYGVQLLPFFNLIMIKNTLYAFFCALFHLTHASFLRLAKRTSLNYYKNLTKLTQFINPLMLCLFHYQ